MVRKICSKFVFGGGGGGVIKETRTLLCGYLQNSNPAMVFFLPSSLSISEGLRFEASFFTEMNCEIVQDESWFMKIWHKNRHRD